MPSDLPSFFVIGAAKSGTTALHEHLSHHPDVSLPAVKETNYFAFGESMPRFTGPGDDAVVSSSLVRTITSRREYVAQFQGAVGARIRGEVCPTYLYYPEAPARIATEVPDARLVAILRNPVDRAFSAFQMLVMTGREPQWDFDRALEREAERIRAGWEHAWHYVGMGRYGEQLARYLEHFDAAQLQVHLHEDFVDDPRKVVGSVLEFVGLRTDVELPLRARHNVSHMPRYRVVDRLLRDERVRGVARALFPLSVRRAVGASIFRKNVRPAEVSLAARQRIVEALRDDIRRTEELISRDLSAWLRT